ncbi:hypothetical protein BDR04DRAFT_1095178 [Suillus decipiens]|nr:hypothetical protein BDR04DRAFT_1095178 [Suillus decipiens]
MSPAGETADTLSTPPRANVPTHGASTIESTPNSRGTAVVSENIGLVGLTVKEKAKQCKADAMLQALLQRASCAPETKQPELLQKCLNAVLPVCNGQVSTGGTHSSGIETALKKYVCPGTEPDFYAPFIEATNIALVCLEEIEVDGMRAPVPAVDMICQQNDMPMAQNHQTVKSIRKPDGILLPLNSACAPFEKQKGKQKDVVNDDKKDYASHDTKRRAHMDTNATAKPKNLPWKDVLACIEFKRKTDSKKPIKLSPHSSHKVNDYVPTKPEYLPVDHFKAPAPSQTPATQPKSDTALEPSRLTTPQPSKGGSSSKRKAGDPLESVAKKTRITPDSDEPDVTIQMGTYAAEMFAANIAVNHLINLIVIDDVMWIWYYDRQGIIQSSGINFIQDLPRFMVLLFALQRFELEDWGRNKNFRPVQVEGKRCHEFKIKDEELGEVDLLLHTSHNERVTHYGLQGRATNVVPVTSEALVKKYGNFQDGMVAKIFWGEASRTSEPEILEKVKEIAKVHDSVKGHIPELLWHHTFTNPTSAIREALGVPEPAAGSRVLYVLVFRKFHPITKLHGKELFDVWYQCILCHVTLWKEGVFHRDVSPGNLMWYWKDGKRMGVLNDYDLSSLIDDRGPRGNERTGTVPFMALDLLTAKAQRGEVKHLYRHDLESFIWVFIWICFRYKEGVLLPEELRPLDEWVRLDAVTCGEKKISFLFHILDQPPSHLESSVWRFLVQCVAVVDTYAFNRRGQLQQQLLQSTNSADKPTNSEESESDIDAFLQSFTNTESWAALNKL